MEATIAVAVAVVRVAAAARAEASRDEFAFEPTAARTIVRAAAFEALNREWGVHHEHSPELLLSRQARRGPHKALVRSECSQGREAL